VCEWEREREQARNPHSSNFYFHKQSTKRGSEKNISERRRTEQKIGCKVSQNSATFGRFSLEFVAGISTRFRKELNECKREYANSERETKFTGKQLNNSLDRAILTNSLLFLYFNFSIFSRRVFHMSFNLARRQNERARVTKESILDNVVSV